MKILIVGSDYVWSIERLYKKYLSEEAGVEVDLFGAQNLFYSYYQQSVLHKVLFRSGLSLIYEKINEQIIAEIGKFRPDLIWVFKGMEVFPSTLRWCKNQGIYLINFNGDNPFIFSGRGSGNKYVTRSLTLYDLHFTYNLEIESRLKDEYELATEFLPFGFDVEEDVYQTCRQQEEINRLCFLGNPDSFRAAFILKLADAGIAIDIYGSKDWGKMVNHRSITIFPPVYGEEFWKILRSYRAQLNLMRPHNENSHNMRSFEIPGIGGIMLAPATTEHKLFFRDGYEAFLFNDVSECVEKGAYILSLTKEEADKIRDQARRRSLTDGYTYRQRAAAVLCHLKEFYEEAGGHSL